MKKKAINNLHFLWPVLLSLTGMRAVAAPAEGCINVGPPEAPRAAISNGMVDAVVMLPDVQHGYYRGVRFDWSGVIPCLQFKGRNFFGVWSPGAEPGTRNHVAGPVEEFRASDTISSPGYDNAKPGEPFLKPGVGVLRRIDEKPYNFNVDYPLIDGGEWTVKKGRDRVALTHVLATPLGISYRYTKTIRLEPNSPVLTMEHEMTNTGSELIDFQVYYHDFFVFDDASTGPHVALRFPFAPTALRSLRSGARIDGKSIVFDRVFEPGETSTSELLGFSSDSRDFDFLVENSKTGASVRQTGSLPLTRVVFWANAYTACPEGYVHILILPGKTLRWTMRYQFSVKS